MLSLNTNLHASISRHLDTATQRQNRGIERLSSSLRINSARDDAAGLAIGSRMTSAIRTQAQLARGINDGIGLIQTAEGALGSVTGILQRCRELALQAANGTLSAHDRRAVNAEYASLVAEVGRIADTTEAFGVFPLKGPARVSSAPITITAPHITDVFPTSGSSGSFSSGIVPIAFIPAGATNVTITMDSLGADDDIQLFSRDGKHLVGTPVLGASGDITWRSRGIDSVATATSRLMTTVNGFLPGATYDDSRLLQGGATHSYLTGGASGSYNGMTFTYSGDGDRYETGTQFNNGSVQFGNTNESVHIDRTTEELLVFVVGQGSFIARATWGSMPPRTTMTLPQPPQPPSDIDILVDAPPQGGPRHVSVGRTPADIRTLGLDGVDLTTQAGAGAAIGAIDGALDKVSRYRAGYGAFGSRFETAIANLGQRSEALSAARSRIMDADYAQVSAEMAKDEMLANAAGAMLAQAKVGQESALELLRETVKNSLRDL